MGSGFQVIVDRDASLAEAPALATKVIALLIKRGIIQDRLAESGSGQPAHFLPGPNFVALIVSDFRDAPDLRADILAVIIGKTVFDAGRYGLELACAGCGVEFYWD